MNGISFGTVVHVILGTVLGIILAIGLIWYVNAMFPFNIYGVYMIFTSTIGVGIFFFYQGIEKEKPLQKSFDVYATFLASYLYSFSITFLILNIMWLCPYFG